MKVFVSYLVKIHPDMPAVLSAGEIHSTSVTIRFTGRQNK